MSLFFSEGGSKMSTCSNISISRMPKLAREKLLTIYRKLLLIRYFEERAAELFTAGSLPGFLHVYIGEEAVAVGVCSALRDDDYITSTHRGHGHVLAKGGNPKLMMAELFGRKTGYCKGKGGSMHIADFSLGIIGANGIVGAGLPIATGVALSAKMSGKGQVVACFFGDGASNQGTFHESLNLASIWDLPIIFVCENNQYAMSTPQRYHQKVERISERASSYRMPGVTVDGNDVLAVYEATLQAADRARRGEGPTLIECLTYRKLGHYVGDPGIYRPKEEVERWMCLDPIDRFRAYLVNSGIATEAELNEIADDAAHEIDEAVRFAEESPWPDPSEAVEDVYFPTEAGKRACYA